MSLLDQLREHTDEHRTGMVYDLVFAVGWVAFVSVLFEFVFVGAPTWAYYLCLLAGVPAYFVFFYSLALAKEQSSS